MKSWRRVGKQDVWALGSFRIKQLGPEVFLLYQAQLELELGQRHFPPARFKKLKDAKDWGRERYEG